MKPSRIKAVSYYLRGRRKVKEGKKRGRKMQPLRESLLPYCPTESRYGTKLTASAGNKKKKGREKGGRAEGLGKAYSFFSFADER